MRVEAVDVEGMRHAPSWSADDLGSRVALPEAPVGSAITDALALFAAALDADRAADLLTRAGLAGPDLELARDDRGLLDQVSGFDAHQLAAITGADGARRVVVRARLSLDPPLFGRLREESARDPRVAVALAGDATITVRVGWLFTNDHGTGSVALHELRVGDTEFPTSRTERPRWADGLLRSVGQRIGLVRPGDAAARAIRLLQASLADDPALRARAARAAAAFAEPPFGWGALALVGPPDAPRVAFGPSLVRARQLGGRAAWALALVEAALLDAPDVLVVPDAVDEASAAWLAARTEGEGATLEQVFHLPDGAAR